MKNKSQKPRLLLTTGDANGIGPELILKIFENNTFTDKYDLTAIGSKKVFDYYSGLLKLKFISKHNLIEIPLPAKFKLKPGNIDKGAGKFSGDAVRTAIELCLNKEYDGVVTLPISKESFNLGGYNYPGHTEMLSELTSSKDTVMILHSEEFSVALVTGHIPIVKVGKTLKEKLLQKKIITVNNSMVKDFKINNPKIAILSLNPHSGDGGLIGTEEQDFILPMIEEMNSVGFNLRGPYASDAFFANKHYKKFDVTIAMYHDQGLIPFKMLCFGSGVNFTAGLNIIRTSPDHGTAFDIAGIGIADPKSTMEAIALAHQLAVSS